MKKKVLILVESPLGNGHLSIARTLVKALHAKNFDVTIATGSISKERVFDFDGAPIVHLPEIFFDSETNTLISENKKPYASDLDTQNKRANIVKSIIGDYDIVLSELFPLGRSYLDDEMKEILDYACSLGTKKPLITTVLRDVYIDPPDVKRDISTLEWMRRYFNKVYVLGDENVIRLSDSWTSGKSNEVAASIKEFDNQVAQYLGYAVLPHESHHLSNKGIGEVVIATGGDFTKESKRIHLAAINARKYSTHLANKIFRHLVSDSCSNEDFEELKNHAELVGRGYIIVERNRSDYLEIISNSELLISHGGYNTAAEIAVARLRALVIPREADLEDDVDEQRFRAEYFSKLGLLKTAKQADLE
jgi:predicted glycosyltransferase